MSDLTRYPLEDSFETELSQEWDGATWTVYLNEAPSFTFPVGVTTVITVNPWKSNAQVAVINAVDTANKTVTVSSISSLELGASISSSQATHGVGSKVIISDNYQFWKDIADAINSKADSAGDTFTGLIQFSGTDHAGIEINNLTTAQRNALTPSNGMLVFDTDDGLFYGYYGGQWNDFDTWTTTPNASETVAGKVEQATNAQVDAETDTWETGAPLFAVPSQLKRIITQASAGTPTTTDSLLFTDGTTAELRAISSFLTDFAATTSQAGFVELPTDAEVETGTDTNKPTTVDQMTKYGRHEFDSSATTFSKNSSTSNSGTGETVAAIPSGANVAVVNIKTNRTSNNDAFSAAGTIWLDGSGGTGNEVYAVSGWTTSGWYARVYVDGSNIECDWELDWDSSPVQNLTVDVDFRY